MRAAIVALVAAIFAVPAHAQDSLELGEALGRLAGTRILACRISDRIMTIAYWSDERGDRAVFEFNGRSEIEEVDANLVDDALIIAGGDDLLRLSAPRPGQPSRIMGSSTGTSSREPVRTRRSAFHGRSLPSTLSAV